VTHLRRTALVAVLAFVVGVVVAPPSSAERAWRYVSLGDSFTAGTYIPPRVGPPQCVRSGNNYPSWLARMVPIASFTDASCGGADTTNMTGWQALPQGGSSGPQFAALRPTTTLVTVSIGGNDATVFSRGIGTCVRLRASDPTGAPCRAFFTAGGVDSLWAETRRTKDRIVDVIRGIHDRSPRATVLAVGYPRLVPSRGTCPEVLPFADGDYAYLDHIGRALNDALSDAAREAGARYVDLYGPSRGHDACAGDRAWVAGAQTDLPAAPYHPLPLGMYEEARVIARALR
jgi:lysophospholipase L1-like esterase